MNDYEAKQQRRRERLEQAAQRAEQRSQAHHDAAHRAVEHIPFGQPILVGHHSERGHRAALRRSHRHMDKFCEEYGNAEQLKHRASRVGKGGISSDDPEALVKLRGKLEKKKAIREQRKAVNAAWRKAGRPRALGTDREPSDEDAAKWERLAEVLGDAGLAAKVRAMMARDFLHRAPFTYELTNAGAEIRRLEQRIAQLEAAAAEPEREPTRGRGFTVCEDKSEHRIRFEFDAKPPRQAGSRSITASASRSRSLAESSLDDPLPTRFLPRKVSASMRLSWPTTLMSRSSRTLRLITSRSMDPAISRTNWMLSIVGERTVSSCSCNVAIATPERTP